MNKGFCIFSILILLLTPFSISAESIYPIEFETDGTYSTPLSPGCEFGREVSIPITGYDTAYLNDDFTTNILIDGQIKFTCGERNNIKLAYYGTNSLWYIASSNLLSTAQQNYVCNNYDYLKSFDTIWYFTDSKALIFGNYINTDSSGYIAFSDCYVLEELGALIAQSNPRKWRDNSNVGAVYKSNGAFNITTNKMSLLNSPCIVYYDVTLSANPTLGGSVSGAGTFKKGTNVTITATPNSDYRFSSWSDGNTTNPRVITLNSNVNLIANFVSTINNPSVNLPTPNEPNITSNTQQSTYINSISSPASQGSVVNYFRYDYFNIYAVHSSALDFSILDEQDILIKYQQDSTGRYLIPVYDHSEVVIYGPNLTISTSGLQITPSLYSGVSYSFPNSNGIIQRDVNRFDYTYVDLQMLNQYPYEDLPFSNSNTNTGKVDYLGQQLSVRSGGTGSRSIMLEFNGQNYSTTFYIVSTDSFKDIEQAKQESNQTTINNNIISNFNELDNTLQHGNSTSQSAQNSNNQINNNLNNTLNNFESIENQYNQNISDNLNQIDLTFDSQKFGSNFLSSAQWFTTQFNNIVLDTPFNGFIIFSCVVGLGLLLLGRFL